MTKQTEKELKLEPRYVERDMDLAIGLAKSFRANSFSEIEKLWNTFQSRMHEIDDVKPGFALGICMASHPDVAQLPDTAFVYAAALPISKLGKIPQGMTLFDIPKGKYAVFTHKGSLDTLSHTVSYIWDKWIPENIADYKHSEGPDFELYDDRFDPKTRTGEIDFYIPVK